MSSNRSSGFGVESVIQVIFIILKCLKLIDWSWWIVLIPLWIDLITCIIIAVWAAYKINNK